MQVLGFLLASFAILAAAYLIVGRQLSRIFGLSEAEDTPAHSMRDGLDYEPSRASALFPQHFSAIAAAGPIVGPILAGMTFGWLPTWLWIIAGSILIGGIHDFTALVASVRHKARSIAEIVRQYMNPRAYVLFMLFVWFALVYVIIAFADVTAGTFVAAVSAAGGDAPGPAVATSSILYLVLAFAMGFALRFGKLGPGKAKLIFLPLVALSILIGPSIPFDLHRLFPAIANPQRVWGYILLVYCFIAAMVPVWALLQPRGELGGYFLYIVMIAAILGIIIGSFTVGVDIQSPRFVGWAPETAGQVQPLFPILFITVACGACSGFHSIVASGTTSKQLRRESDAKPIAYGGMLMEGFFACLSLATVMVLAKPAGKPDAIYANGIAHFAALIFQPFGGASEGVKSQLLVFALLCFATFVFDTLDACTRLSRYVLMELLGWTSRAQAVFATAVSLVIPFIALSLPQVTINNVPQPLWKVFWGIFGSSNQLLAALTLLGVTVWLAKRKLPFWLALGPALFMMVMTLWSLVLYLPPYFKLLGGDKPINPFQHMQFGITVSLIVMAIWLIAEAIITWREMTKPPESAPQADSSLTAQA